MPKKILDKKIYPGPKVYKKMLNITLLIIALLGLLFFWKYKWLGKKKDQIRGITGVIVVVAVLFMFLLPTVIPDFIGNIKFQSAAPGSSGEESFSGSCPTDGDSSIKVNVYNALNNSGSENYDVTMYLLDNSGQIVDTISDTTSPSATTVNCGQSYTLAAVTSDSDGGDNSYIKSSNIGSVNDGKITFTADKSNMNFNVKMAQHGVLEFALYDNLDARFAYDSGDASNVGFEGEPVTFEDGDNTTAFAVAAGGKLDFTLKLEGTNVDTDFMDYYTLIAVEAPVSEYNEPQVWYDGVRLTNIKGSGLTSDEVTKLADYEYVYKIMGPIEDNTHDLGFKMTATSTDPSTDVQIDFYSAGNYKSTSEESVKTGAAKDDSSKTATFTVQDVTIDVS